MDAARLLCKYSTLCERKDETTVDLPAVFLFYLTGERCFAVFIAETLPSSPADSCNRQYLGCQVTISSKQRDGEKLINGTAKGKDLKG